MKRLLLSLSAVATLVVAPGCGAVAPYAAIVDGSRITKADLDNELKAIQSNEEYLNSFHESVVAQGGAVKGQGNRTFDAAFVAQTLTNHIFLELIHQEIVEQKVKVTAEALQAADAELRENVGAEETLDKFPKSYVEVLVRRNAEVTALRDHLARQEVSDADVERLYREQPGRFSETCASHILVETRAAADSVRARLLAGASFEEVARAESKDTGSGQQGGSLGCVSSTEAAGFVAPFRQAMQSLPLNELSQPVETQFGFHIIKVTGRTLDPLADVRAAIREELSGGAAGAAFERFILDAARQADVDVNPRYGRWVPGDEETGEPPRVEPPRKPSTSTTAAGPQETPGAPPGFEEPPPPPSGQ